MTVYHGFHRSLSKNQMRGDSTYRHLLSKGGGGSVCSGGTVMLRWKRGKCSDLSGIKASGPTF